jgi:nucleotide-binding universal stress UspA family protein
MRILLAYDGSPGSQQALALAGALAWPEGSSIRVVLVVEPTLAALGPTGSPGAFIPAPELDEAVMAAQGAQVDEAVRTLARDGRPAEGAVLIGRPGTVLVDEATRFRADLVMAGSRGQGPIASLVLGSVSSEVIDHAPCPVLVVRGPGITKVLFATDGSEASAAAGELLRSWPIFEGLPIRVVSVADVDAPWHTGIAPTMHARVAAAHAEDIELARAEHSQVLERAATTLRAAGRPVETSLRTGDAAGEIIAAAEEAGADLVVLGSRGRTGVTRLLLGSVARNVLQGSRTSVLVVHAPGDQASRPDPTTE